VDLLASPHSSGNGSRTQECLNQRTLRETMKGARGSQNLKHRKETSFEPIKSSAKGIRQTHSPRKDLPADKDLSDKYLSHNDRFRNAVLRQELLQTRPLVKQTLDLPVGQRALLRGRTRSLQFHIVGRRDMKAMIRSEIWL